VEVLLSDHRADVFPYQDGAAVGLNHMARQGLAAARAVLEAAADVVRGLAIALLAVAFAIRAVVEQVLYPALGQARGLVVAGPEDGWLTRA
jgi:hypothetical protein